MLEILLRPAGCEGVRVPAKMPLEFVEKPYVPVTELAVGESGFLSIGAVCVADDLSTYIRGAAVLRPKSTGAVRVERTSTGYRLVLRDGKLRFKQEQIKNDSDLIPVDEIVAAIEEDLFESRWKKLVAELSEEESKPVPKAPDSAVSTE